MKTVQGESIKLSLKGGKLTLNGGPKVIVADVKASNGVIHAIDTVIVPPSVAGVWHEAHRNLPHGLRDRRTRCLGEPRERGR